jgi:charged multivesicular body protein 7
VPLQHFLTAPGNIFARGWGEVPWNVLGWTLRQLGVVDPARGEDKLPAGRYVMMENLETAARELNARMASRTSIFDRVFTARQFEQVFVPELVPGQSLTGTDLEVLLKFLSRDKQMIEYDGHTIRIRGTAGDSGPITEQDATIASIKELTANLKHQINLLEARIDQLGETAKTALGRKNRVSALAALKSKKMAESSLSTRYATLNQLEEVASRIEQAADQVALVKVMESSSTVLEKLNRAVGGTEKVDGVMDRLREQMADTDEVAAILAESSGQAVDESEIDDELEALEREEKEREEAAERKAEEAEAREKLDELPTVPGEELPQREKETTPTAETGIANLSMEDKTAQSALN